MTPMDWGPTGSSVPGISQARIPQWAAMLSLPRFSWKLQGAGSQGGLSFYDSALMFETTAHPWPLKSFTGLLSSTASLEIVFGFIESFSWLITESKDKMSGWYLVDSVLWPFQGLIPLAKGGTSQVMSEDKALAPDLKTLGGKKKKKKKERCNEPSLSFVLFF